MLRYFIIKESAEKSWEKQSFHLETEEEPPPLNKTEGGPPKIIVIWFWFCPFYPMSPAIHQYSGYMGKRPQGNGKSS